MYQDIIGWVKQNRISLAVLASGKSAIHEAQISYMRKTLNPATGYRYTPEEIAEQLGIDSSYVEEVLSKPVPKKSRK
jgi:hypothetical protein